VIRVLLADDQQLVRAGFGALLDAEDDIEVVGEADDGDVAVRMATDLAPDVVLMDIRMPGVDGLEATRRIVEDASLDRTRIVILTTFDIDEYVFEALRVGASGFLVKDTEPELLLSGVRAVARGDALLSPAVARRVLGAFADRSLPALPQGSDADRYLATVMFSDIVASTERAVEVGDRDWRAELDRHDALVREELDAHGGRAIKSTGDGVLAAFDAPARAIDVRSRSAIACVRSVSRSGSGCTPGRSSAAVTTSEGSRSTSDLALPTRAAPATSWSRARSVTWSPAPASVSTTTASTS